MTPNAVDSMLCGKYDKLAVFGKYIENNILRKCTSFKKMKDIEVDKNDSYRSVVTRILQSSPQYGDDEIDDQIS